jgi:hypothetical protein
VGDLVTAVMAQSTSNEAAAARMNLQAQRVFGQVFLDQALRNPIINIRPSKAETWIGVKVGFFPQREIEGQHICTINMNVPVEGTIQSSFFVQPGTAVEKYIQALQATGRSESIPAELCFSETDAIRAAQSAQAAADEERGALQRFIVERDELRRELDHMKVCNSKLSLNLDHMHQKAADAQALVEKLQSEGELHTHEIHHSCKCET